MRSVLNYLRRCALCESLFGGEFGICPDCSRFCEKQSLEITIMPPSFPFPAHRLFISTDRDDFARRLVVTLKGDHRFRLWNYFARLFFLRRMVMPAPLGSPVLVPAPSSTNRAHAHLFAQQISELTGWPVWDLLVSGETHSQKEKGRGERKQKELHLRVQNPLLPNHTVVLIDDLMATGSTATAAWQALGQPRLEAWVLTHQLLLH